MMEHISSLQNPKIKELVRWQIKARQRVQDQVILVEGIKENQLAQAAGLSMQSAFIQSEWFAESFSLPRHVKQFSVTQPIFEKIAYRSTTGGILGVYQAPQKNLNTLQWKSKALFVVLESVEKPGNLGAVLRSADAAGATAVVVCDARTDLYNPNVIRSSLGTIFTTPTVTCTTQEWLQFAAKNEIHNFATHLNAATTSLYHQDYTQNTAFILGTEATGLSNSWLTANNTTIKIPMLGSIDSLNVSNAAAICLYEAVRQRLENQS